jgi:type VI secretion system secreted protein Hcp
MKTGKMSGARRAIQVVLAAGAVAGAAQPAMADDIFLSIPGVPGDSLDSKHKGAIDVLSFTQVADGKACLVTVTKRVDRSSPPLTAAAMGKSSFASATLTIRKSGETPLEYYVLSMQSVTVQDVAQSGSRDGTPVEEVGFVPRSVTLTITPQDAKGGAGTPVTTSYTCPK